MVALRLGELPRIPVIVGRSRDMTGHRVMDRPGHGPTTKARHVGMGWQITLLHVAIELLHLLPCQGMVADKTVGRKAWNMLIIVVPHVHRWRVS